MTHSPKLLVWALLGLPALAAPAQAEAPASHNPLGFGGAAALAASLPAADTRDLVREVIQRSPEIARARRLAAAAEARAPQVAALPDPVAAVTYFVRGPQTRTGAQRLRASLQQRLPWFGTLDLRERAALLGAARARAEVETARWRLATEARHAASELAFLGAYERIVRSERGTLERFEKVAQARYAAGNGLQQEIVRIQAQITTADTRLLEIGERRAALSSRINRLRDQPTGTPLPTPP
ncbi:MAG: TolC family protein, partial [Acidobacteriota bacterium]